MRALGRWTLGRSFLGGVFFAALLIASSFARAQVVPTLPPLVDELPDRRCILDRGPQRNVGGKARPLRRQADEDRRLAAVGERRVPELDRHRPAIGIGEQLALPEHQRARPRILPRRIAGTKLGSPVELTGVKGISVIQGST